MLFSDILVVGHVLLSPPGDATYEGAITDISDGTYALALMNSTYSSKWPNGEIIHLTLAELNEFGWALKGDIRDLVVEWEDD